MGKGTKPRRQIVRRKAIAVATTRSKKRVSPGQKMASLKKRHKTAVRQEIEIPVKYVLDLQELKTAKTTRGAVAVSRYSVKIVISKEHRNLLKEECNLDKYGDFPNVILLTEVPNLVPYPRMHLKQCSYAKTKRSGRGGQYGEGFVVVELAVWDWNGYGDLMLDNPMPELRMWK